MHNRDYFARPVQHSRGSYDYGRTDLQPDTFGGWYVPAWALGGGLGGVVGLALLWFAS